MARDRDLIPQGGQVVCMDSVSVLWRWDTMCAVICIHLISVTPSEVDRSVPALSLRVLSSCMCLSRVHKVQGSDLNMGCKAHLRISQEQHGSHFQIESL